MIICELKNITNICKYKVDGLIIANDYTCYSESTYSIDDIKFIANYCRQNGILSIALVDKIYEEEELPQLCEFLEYLITLDIDYYMYSDFAVLAYFEKMGLLHKLIYDSKTLITNEKDALWYHNKGIKVTISNEISLDDIKTIACVKNSILEVYGYHQIFYSRRNLITSFNRFLNNTNDYKDKILSIKEDSRDERYPIIENKNGTFIFGNRKLCFYLELPSIKNDILMFKINSLLIDEDNLFMIIGLFNAALHGEMIDMQENYQKLISIYSDIGNSFLYTKSILHKEDGDE